MKKPKYLENFKTDFNEIEVAQEGPSFLKVLQKSSWPLDSDKVDHYLEDAKKGDFMLSPSKKLFKHLRCNIIKVERCFLVWLPDQKAPQKYKTEEDAAHTHKGMEINSQIEFHLMVDGEHMILPFDLAKTTQRKAAFLWMSKLKQMDAPVQAGEWSLTTLPYDTYGHSVTYAVQPTLTGWTDEENLKNLISCAETTELPPLIEENNPQI